MIYIYPKDQKNLLTIPEEISCMVAQKHKYEPFSASESKDYFLDTCVNCGLIRLGLKNDSTSGDFRNYLASIDFKNLVDKAILDRNKGLVKAVLFN